MMTEEMAFKNLPQGVQGGLLRYIQQGIEPGGFLMAVLCNDLKESLARADHNNRHRIYEIVEYLYNFAPSICWGSESKVIGWINAHSRVPSTEE